MADTASHQRDEAVLRAARISQEKTEENASPCGWRANNGPTMALHPRLQIRAQGHQVAFLATDNEEHSIRSAHERILVEHRSDRHGHCIWRHDRAALKQITTSWPAINFFIAQLEREDAERVRRR